MARSSNSGGGLGPILKWGLITGGLYLGYRWWSGSAATAPAGAPGTAVGPAAPTTSPGPQVAFNSLDSIYQRMLAQAAAAKFGGKTADTLNADEWRYYLGKVWGGSIPDVLAVFTQPGFDRTTAMTSAVFWSQMAPALASSAGLHGLGVYGGLGALIRSRR